MRPFNSSRALSIAGFDIPGALSETWQQFVSAGDAYLKDLALEDYPEEGKSCLYCQQDLSTTAVALLRQYHDYCNNTLKDDVDAAIHDAVGQHVCRCTGYVRYYKAIRQVVLDTPGLTT